ncbi:hypothetical protein HYU82_01285 [Candidatus Saccharibacteria bacterium]|nr:hypothetical protein [Candidatus Saccharibacteria bacterium]
MSRFRRVFAGVVTLSVLALLVFGLFNLQAIEDWLRLRNYTPPAAIAAIAKADTMTDDAKHIFYVTHPDLINEANAFRQSCPSFEQTIVLGCYHSGFSSAIYIYNVQDTRLNGVVEVTAAHEMLHAAYDRLGQDDKSRINGLLNDFYSNDLRDKRVLETIDTYKQTEPDELLNEMHSIFATEVGGLTFELESYYQRYFGNRSAVVAFASKYADEFASRIATIKDYEQQLVTLKAKIDSQEQALGSQLEQLEADRRRLDSLRASGQIGEYNAAVPAFNGAVNDYNDGVVQLRADIAQYNQLVAAHNALAAELSSLYDSLDTSLAPQTAR